MLNTSLPLILRLRICGAMPPLEGMLSWRALEHLYLSPFYLSILCGGKIYHTHMCSTFKM
jgi:hypothetical protein